MNGLWLWLRLIKLYPPLYTDTRVHHRESKLIWWRFIIINTNIPPPPSMWYKCSLSIGFLAYSYRTDLIIYRKKEQKNERSFSFFLPPMYIRPAPSPFLGRCWTERHCAGCRDRYARWDSSDTIEGYYSHLLNLLSPLCSSAPLFISYIYSR
jgi:hypothetical protein